MLQIRLGDASTFTRSASPRTDATATSLFVQQTPTRSATPTVFSPAPNPAVDSYATTAKSNITVDRQAAPSLDTNVQPTSGNVVAVDTGSGSILVHDDPARDPATGVLISPGMPDASKSLTPTDGYRCDSFACRGTGLYDLQFHQLQTLMNQAAGKLGLATIRVDGVIDASSTLPLVAAIANSGMVPGFTMPVDVAFDPQWVADNVSALIWALGSTLQDPGWKTGLLTTATPKSIVRPDPTPPAGAGPQVMYVCPDGVTKVTDPMMCVSSTPPADGGGDTYYPGGGGSGSGSGVVVTAPDGSTTVVPTTMAPAWKTAATKVARSPITIGVLGILGGIFLGSLVLRNS